jgi:hypothetical protein
MINFILYVVVTSGWIWGVNCLFSENHIFEKAGDWIHENLPEWIYKPTIGCAACMSSIHGTISYFIFAYKDFGLWLWPVFCIVLCGLNFVIIKLTTKERIIVDE